VEAAARVPLGSPLAFTDPAPIEERVRSLPEVRDATVSRSWPNTIRIEVTEREPVFVLNSEGAYWLVDADGVTYHRVGSPPEGLLVAVAETTDGTVLRDIATVVSSLPEALAERVTQVRAATADSITLMLTGNARVIWGSAADSELKGQVATALLGQKATIYDVSSPTHPVTR
jgi:cell division protein FtsQ